MDILKRLEEVEARYEELNLQIADPSSMSDMERYTKLTREHSELREIVEVIEQFKNALDTISESKALLGDPELGELAGLGERHSSSKSCLCDVFLDLLNRSLCALNDHL